MAETRRSFDVVVVGAGPAGVAAATVAAESGGRVAVVDDTPWLGGHNWRGKGAKPRSHRARAWI
jgi:flavin-dependent dehydrogenase